jgi:hypothetical protein
MSFLVMEVSAPTEHFKIPAPYRAWCHLCKGEDTVPGIRGRGFATLDELMEHDGKVHNRK